MICLFSPLFWARTVADRVAGKCWRSRRFVTDDQESWRSSVHVRCILTTVLSISSQPFDSWLEEQSCLSNQRQMVVASERDARQTWTLTLILYYVQIRMPDAASGIYIHTYVVALMMDDIYLWGTNLLLAFGGELLRTNARTAGEELGPWERGEKQPDRSQQSRTPVAWKGGRAFPILSMTHTSSLFCFFFSTKFNSAGHAGFWRLEFLISVDELGAWDERGKLESLSSARSFLLRPMIRFFSFYFHDGYLQKFVISSDTLHIRRTDMAKQRPSLDAISPSPSS